MDAYLAKFAREWYETQELYEVMCLLADKGIYDDDYCSGLLQLEQRTEDKSQVLYLKARMHYAAGEYGMAADAMVGAIRYRAINFDYWALLVEIYEKLSNRPMQSFFATLLAVNGGSVDDRFLLPMNDDDGIQAVGQARIAPSSAPFYVQFFFHEGKLDDGYGNLAGRYIQWWNKEEYCNFCCVYNNREWRNKRAGLASLLHEKHSTPHDYCEFPYELMKCVERRKLRVHCPKGRECIIPIAATEIGQRLSFSREDNCKEISGSKWEFSFYRLDEGNTTITSDYNFQVAKPIPLCHSKHRRKLVLNILADGLPWQVLKKQGYKSVPNIMRFFSKGVIFDNHFSVSEYTFPALAGIETGCYPYNNQIFNDKILVHLADEFATISEQMNALGYYCVNLISDGSGIYNDVLRGFDRQIISQITVPAYEGVNRVIEHLEAFAETDNYVYIHVSDPHPYNSNVQLSPYAQVQLPWKERVFEEYDTSVNKKCNELNMLENQHSIKLMDRYFGLLFDYIEEHYAEDEYLVSLYSDHGVSIYDNENYILSENQSGAAMMLRGAPIPKLGLVEELTSSVDFYPIMARYLDFPLSYEHIDGCLPKTFGGDGRKYAASMSIFPGQTFKLCLRNERYEFRLESVLPVLLDGRVDMSDYRIQIYSRNNRQKVHNEGIRRQFLKEALSHMKSFVFFTRKKGLF